MKKIIFSLLTISALISGCFLVQAQEDPAGDKVIVYYFHGSFRCATCTAMEKYSREAVETNFKDALASGKLEFKEVNVEEPANEHFTDDYKLYTKSLILSQVKDGKEIKSKNLDKIWEYARNKDKFVGYVTNEVNCFLEEAK